MTDVGFSKTLEFVFIQNKLGKTLKLKQKPFSEVKACPVEFLGIRNKYIVDKVSYKFMT